MPMPKLFKHRKKRDQPLYPNREIRALTYWVFQLYREVKKMSAALDRLTTEVSEMSEVVDSAVALIEGLAQQIRDLKDDPAKLEALADELDNKGSALAAAVVTGTPAEEPPQDPEA